MADLRTGSDTTVIAVPAPLSTTGGGTEATALRVTVATDSTGVVSVDDNDASLTVDNAGTFATQVDGAALTSLQLIDDVVYTDDTSTHATGTSKGVLIMAAAVPTDTSVNANDMGAVAMTTDRRLLVDASGVAVPVTDNAGSLSVDWNGTQPVTGSGTATGALRVELANNSTGILATVGAVTAITNAFPTGANVIGNVGLIPRTTGGLTTYHLVSAASTNATNVKASAGQLFGWFIYNNNAAMRKVAFHNTAGTPTAGASIFFTLNIPGSGAANMPCDIGIAFSTGIAFTTVTDNTDAGATAVGSGDLTINLFYA